MPREATSILLDANVMCHVLHVALCGMTSLLDAADLVRLSRVCRAFCWRRHSLGNYSLVEKAARDAMVSRGASPHRALLPGESWLFLLHLAEVAMAHLHRPMPVGTPMLHPHQREASWSAIAHVITLDELGCPTFKCRSPSSCHVAMVDSPERLDHSLTVLVCEGLVQHLGRLVQRLGHPLSLYRWWVLQLASCLEIAGEFHGATELLRGFIPAATRCALGDEIDIDSCWCIAPALELADVNEENLVLVLSKISEFITTKSYCNTFISKEDFDSGLAAAYGVEALHRARRLGIDGVFLVSSALAAEGASLALCAQASAYRHLSPYWRRKFPSAAEQFSDAKDALEECVKLRHRLKDPTVARALHILGELYFCAATANLVGTSCFQGAPSAVLAHIALRHMREAQAMYEASGRVLCVEYADLLKDLGKVLLYSGCPEDGALWLQRSFRLHSTLCGPSHPRSRNVLTLLMAAGDEGEGREEGVISDEEQRI
eukprot:GGOE01012172.1.p1 GENE.GGOE01012172.1~~GGOE01012172.1.p1  ORF type:complete len:489 (+),score=92.18 GGOE01012172.1:93-1559(+)